MYGSLSQFLGERSMQRLNSTCVMSKPEHQFNRNQIKHSSLQNKNRKKIFQYEPSDKSKLIQIEKKKQKIVYKPNHQIMAWFSNQIQDQNKNQKKQHWVENSIIDKDKLMHKHKILRAVAKTQQSEARMNPKTHFQNSFDRISKGYAKLNTLPSRRIVINPLRSGDKFSRPQKLIQKQRGKSCSLSPQKIVNLQKSIHWAKTHNQNYNCYYQQLGKSIMLVDKQTQGRNNYILQQEHTRKEGEFYRKKNRKKFLEQIQKRLATQNYIYNE